MGDGTKGSGHGSGPRPEATPARRPLRVVYYSSAIQLEPTLSWAPELNRHVEFHLLLELAPDAWSSALFDVPPRPLPSGITPGDPVLHDCVPAAIRSHWQQTASFHLVVHNYPKSLHPRTWWVSLQAARFIRSLRPDVLHVDNWNMRLAPVVWMLRGIPLVITLHDPEPHSGEHNWRVDLARNLTAPFVDRYLLLNEAGREGWRQRFRIPSEQVCTTHLGPHGMCKEWLVEPPSEEERTVLFFGRLSQYKGLHVFYEAAIQVARRVPSVRFVVAGRAVPGYTLPEPPELPNGGSVEVLHRYLHNRETAELFERSTVVACPYVDATQSGVVLTAFAFGKAVVATRVGGLPDYVEDGVTGLLVEPGNAAKLAEALIRLLEDKGLRLRLRAGIAARVQTTLSWAASAERLAGCYARAAAGHRDGKD
jgi:glycosyltransferase involved in cell wall biosynthesis